MILKGTSTESEIEAEAVKDGMITMAQDGLLKALDGMTSVDEVLAVANTDTMAEEPEVIATQATPVAATSEVKK